MTRVEIIDANGRVLAAFASPTRRSRLNAARDALRVFKRTPGLRSSGVPKQIRVARDGATPVATYFRLGPKQGVAIQ